MKTYSKKRWYLLAPPLILMGVALCGFITMTLWNALLPSILHLPVITFWQALGLLILSRLFFGGHHWHRGGHAHWRNRMVERWEKMTPEEREQFRQRWPHRNGWNKCWGEPSDAAKKEETV